MISESQQLFYDLFVQLQAGTLTVDQADRTDLEMHHRQVLLEGITAQAATANLDSDDDVPTLEEIRDRLPTEGNHSESQGTQANTIPAGQSHVVIQPASGVTLIYQGISYDNKFVLSATAGRGTPELNSTKLTGGNYNWGAWA